MLNELLHHPNINTRGVNTTLALWSATGQWSVHHDNKMDTGGGGGGGDNGSYSVHVGDKLAMTVLWFGCDMDLSVSQCIGAIQHFFFFFLTLTWPRALLHK